MIILNQNSQFDKRRERPPHRVINNFTHGQHGGIVHCNASEGRTARWSRNPRPVDQSFKGARFEM